MAGRLPWYYRLALMTYPRAFRDAYGGDLGKSIRDEVREGRGGTLLRLINLALVGVLERWAALTHSARPRGPASRQVPRRMRHRAGAFETVLQDLRYAVRTLRKAPGFTFVAVATLGLAIAGTTAIFSVVNTVLLEPFPFDDPDRLVFMWQDDGQIGNPRTSVSPPNYVDWRDQTTSFEAVGALAFPWTVTTAGDGTPERLDAGVASAEFFTTMGVLPSIGRTFLEGEDEAGGEGVAVLSHGLWQRRYGGSDDIVGRRIQIDGLDHTVVGVMPPSFKLPGADADLWLPFSFLGRRLGFRFQRFLWVFGRLKPGVTLAQARADVGAVAAGLEEQFPDTNRNVGVTMVSLNERFLGDVQLPIVTLFAAGILVLLIGCANVANLMLTRATARSGELAVRTALGAGKGRIARQLTTESVVLAVAAALVGLLLARIGLSSLVSWSPGGVPRLDEVRIDGTVLAFTASVSLGVALLVGVAPSLSASLPNVAARLNSGGRAVTAGSTKARWRSALSVFEVSLAAMLLIAGGLLIRSYYELRTEDPGFVADHVVTAGITLPAARYDNLSARHGFFTALLERVQAMPGVVAAGGINRVPLLQTRMSTRVTIDGQPPLPPDRLPDVGFYRVTTDYFRTVGVPLLAGRMFGPEDGLNADRGVVMVNQAFADQHFPDEDPVGQRLKSGSSEEAPWWEVIGVVGSIKREALAAPPDPEFYYHYLQSSSTSYTLAVKMAGDPLSVVAPIRQAVRDIDADLPVYRVHLMDEILLESVARERFTTLLLVTFAGVALVLAVVGVYGVISVNVSQRASEFAVRMAFGADRDGLLTMVVKQAALVAGGAVVLGVVGAVGMSRVFGSLLYGVSSTDPLTYVAVSLGLVALAALASYVPAWRATRVEPMTVLRGE